MSAGRKYLASKSFPNVWLVIEGGKLVIFIPLQEELWSSHWRPKHVEFVLRLGPVRWKLAMGAVAMATACLFISGVWRICVALAALPENQNLFCARNDWDVFEALSEIFWKL